MDATEAIKHVQSWCQNPNIRPQPQTAREVSLALVNRILELEQQMEVMRGLVTGRQVLIQRGNPGRGPETGPGYGRRVPAVIEQALTAPHQVTCRLLADDPDAIGKPNQAGESGMWSISQIITD